MFFVTYCVICKSTSSAGMTLTPVTIIQHGEIVNARHATIIHLDSYVDLDVRIQDWAVAICNLH